MMIKRTTVAHMGMMRSSKSDHNKHVFVFKFTFVPSYFESLTQLSRIPLLMATRVRVYKHYMYTH